MRAPGQRARRHQSITRAAHARQSCGILNIRHRLQDGTPRAKKKKNTHTTQRQHIFEVQQRGHGGALRRYRWICDDSAAHPVCESCWFAHKLMNTLSNIRRSQHTHHDDDDDDCDAGDDDSLWPHVCDRRAAGSTFQACTCVCPTPTVIYARCFRAIDRHIHEV